MGGAQGTWMERKRDGWNGWRRNTLQETTYEVPRNHVRPPRWRKQGKRKKKEREEDETDDADRVHDERALTTRRVVHGNERTTTTPRTDVDLDTHAGERIAAEHDAGRRRRNERQWNLRDRSEGRTHRRRDELCCQVGSRRTTQRQGRRRTEARQELLRSQSRGRCWCRRTAKRVLLPTRKRCCTRRGKATGQAPAVVETKNEHTEHRTANHASHTRAHLEAPCERRRKERRCKEEVRRRSCTS